MLKNKVLCRADPQYEKHRIPGLIVTRKGTLLFYEEARRSASDWAMMNILLSRSTDNGESFDTPVILAEGTEDHPTVNNPVMVEDKNGRIHFLYCEDYGTNGGRVLRRYSDDDGASWSAPIDISRFTAPEFRNCFALGPGHGICLSNGRLVIPVWMVPKKFEAPIDKHDPSVVTTLISDDMGDSWTLGDILWSNADVQSPNETSAAELEDGSVYLNIRSKCYHRAQAYSKDGMSEWTNYERVTSLPDPHCFGSLFAMNDKNGNRLLFFVNCASNKERNNVTLRVSLDGGRTFERSLLIDELQGGYCEISGDAERGLIYVIYETNFGETCQLVRLNVNEIL